MFGRRGDVNKSVVDFPCRLAALARHAPKRCIGRAVSLGVYEIEDRFRLFVGELPVEKRALGEFAAVRKARARGEACLEDAARRHGAAVALELDDILAGVGMGGLEGKRDAIV